LGVEGKTAISGLRGLAANEFVRVEASCFLNAVGPFNVVPEGNDDEGKPRMGKWYAFLQLEKGVWDRW
jgi:hypothetical protein